MILMMREFKLVYLHAIMLSSGMRIICYRIIGQTTHYHAAFRRVRKVTVTVTECIL
jgi:hypothetical protein